MHGAGEAPDGPVEPELVQGARVAGGAQRSGAPVELAVPADQRHRRAGADDGGLVVGVGDELDGPAGVLVGGAGGDGLGVQPSGGGADLVADPGRCPATDPVTEEPVELGGEPVVEAVELAQERLRPVRRQHPGVELGQRHRRDPDQPDCVPDPPRRDAPRSSPASRGTCRARPASSPRLVSEPPRCLRRRVPQPSQVRAEPLLRPGRQQLDRREVLRPSHDGKAFEQMSINRSTRTSHWSSSPASTNRSRPSDFAR